MAVENEAQSGLGNSPAFDREPAVEAVTTNSSDEESQVSENDAPINHLVQSIIAEAIRRRASDIHLEPLERIFRVRYRIDGVLLEATPPPKRLQLAIISRLKIMANISIAEKRLPQDGRIQVVAAGRALDLRVSSLPTAHGESIVMRVLDQEGLKLGLPELGFLPDDQKEFERLIASPDGIVLVTGPTGSGKTTTLYACLHQLNQTARKIITVEEPVEYQISGINQVPVNASIGMTFAAALRAMLRQAPNIVMVGEIRDRETAEIAINASLTGHLVFSTLHTNDAPSAVTRLIDIGAKPFLVAASLRASMAQRLVRRNCPQCRCSYTPSVRELHALDLTAAQLATATFMHGTGCAACHGTGYLGRLGIFEIFLVNDEIRAMISGHASASRLRQRARKDGLRTMREDGIRKVLAGHTTIAEVVSITVGDEL
jgi:general secretion pathway protein E/type IV pilus assembly protein PilB